jgi:hypothetical protein
VSANRPRRAQRFAERAHEQRELARRDPDRPRQVTTALTHLREARLELMAGYRITEAAEIEAIIRRLEKAS